MSAVRCKKHHLSDAYCFDGFRPAEGKLRGVFGGPKGRVLPLIRRTKKLSVVRVAPFSMAGMTGSLGLFETYPAVIPMCTWRSNSDEWTVGSAAK
jgi:hypothetical protein